jgi:hypothetical protein
MVRGEFYPSGVDPLQALVGSMLDGADKAFVYVMQDLGDQLDHLKAINHHRVSIASKPITECNKFMSRLGKTIVIRIRVCRSSTLRNKRRARR